MSKLLKSIWWVVVVAFVILLTYNIWQGNFAEVWWMTIPAASALVVALVVQKKSKL